MSTSTQQTKTRAPVIRNVLIPMRDYLSAHSRLIGAAIPPRLQAQINAGAVIASVLIELEREPKLLKCSPESLLRSTLMAVELGARVGAAWGEAYLIPYGQDCQFQVGYRLLQRLAYEAGAVDMLTAAVVGTKEIEQGRFDLTYAPPAVKHAPILMGTRGDIAGAYFVGYRRQQVVGVEWASKEEIERIRKAGQGNTPAWRDWWEEMARKAVTKRGLKRIPVGVDATILQRAIHADNQAERGEPQQAELLPLDLTQAEREAVAAAALACEEARGRLSADGPNEDTVFQEWAAQIREATTPQELTAVIPRIGKANLPQDLQARLRRVVEDQERSLDKGRT